jgi:hypothetical protein
VDNIRKKSTTNIYYWNYPIKTAEISVYIPAEVSGGVLAALNAASIGAQMTKPVSIVLFIVAAPVAIALLKVLQALEFLQYINVKNQPNNVQFILSLVGEGNVFAGLMGPVESLYKIDDGTGNDSEDRRRRLLV